MEHRVFSDLCWCLTDCDNQTTISLFGIEINKARLYKALNNSDNQPNVNLAQLARHQSRSQEVLDSIPTGDNLFAVFVTIYQNEANNKFSCGNLRKVQQICRWWKNATATILLFLIKCNQTAIALRKHSVK